MERQALERDKVPDCQSGTKGHAPDFECLLVGVAYMRWPSCSCYGAGDLTTRQVADTRASFDLVGQGARDPEFDLAIGFPSQEFQQ